jgi:micrococcal nuclease
VRYLPSWRTTKVRGEEKVSRNHGLLIGVLSTTIMVVCLVLGCCLLGYVVLGVGADAARSPEPAITSPFSLSPTGSPSARPAEQTVTPTPSTRTPQPSPTSQPTAMQTLTWTPAPTESRVPESPAATSTPSWAEGRVTHIIDGDTIEVEIAGQVYSLRYIGIECPESGQYGSELATRVNRELVEGKSVRLETDVSDTDQYGRLLRYVYVGDLFVNAELVGRGYATAWAYPPDLRYADLFAQLEREAQDGERGLWAAPTPTSGPGWNCVGNIYNCGDFSSCDEMMSYWSACPGDPSRLDGDHDGRPCESLCQ